MNKAILFLSIALISMLLVTTVAIAGKGKPGAKECNDGIDNDGDSYIDLADQGCDNKGDNDETNCGDGVCEGGETSETCPADCGQPNSCSDTDFGFSPFLQGTVSGYQGGEGYSYTDYCLDSTMLKEYYCSGTTPLSNNFDCQFNFTTCSNGACV